MVRPATPSLDTPRMSLMTSDDEKDPPVPADLVEAPKRIRRDRNAEDYDRSGRKASAEKPKD
jgi:hypothetical protein